MAEKLTLPMRKVLELRRGLNSLDAVKAGKEGEVVPLDFDPKTRYRLMKNAAIVEREALIFDKMDRGFAEQSGAYDGMEKNDANAAKMDAYKRKLEEALDQNVDLDGLLFVRMEDLLFRPLPSDAKPTDKRKSNPVPQSVLHKLMPIIVEEDASG